MVAWRVKHFSPISFTWPIWNVFIWTAQNTSKTHASDTDSVRGSTHNIRAWANISWQLWLIKCLTSPSYSPSLLMQNEHENLANKARRRNSSPAIAEEIRFMFFTTIFILLESSTPTKNLCCQQILGRTQGKCPNRGDWVCPYREAAAIDSPWGVIRP